MSSINTTAVASPITTLIDSSNNLKNFPSNSANSYKSKKVTKPVLSANSPISSLMLGSMTWSCNLATSKSFANSYKGSYNCSPDIQISTQEDLNEYYINHQGCQSVSGSEKVNPKNQNFIMKHWSKEGKREKFNFDNDNVSFFNDENFMVSTVLIFFL